ncbi:MAG: MauE/DoxX family redox-associated membrane protein [Planctomycetota bacterium]
MNGKATKSSLSTAVYRAIQVGIGALLMLSGIEHMLDPYDLMSTLHRQSFVPELMVTPVTVLLPVANLLLGGIFVFGCDLPGVYLVSTVLAIAMVVFGLLRILLAADATSDCGCFGSTEGDLIDFNAYSLWIAVVWGVYSYLRWATAASVSSVSH